MNAKREKVSDARIFAAAALLILLRLALAISFAYLLTFIVFDTSLRMPRLLLGTLVSLIGLAMGTSLLRQYSALPSVVLSAACLAAILFLAIAWRFHISRIPPRSVGAEISAVIISALVATSAIVYGFRSKRRRKA